MSDIVLEKLFVGLGVVARSINGGKYLTRGIAEKCDAAASRERFLILGHLGWRAAFARLRNFLYMTPKGLDSKTPKSIIQYESGILGGTL
jgi:hypothetical protein